MYEFGLHGSSTPHPESHHLLGCALARLLTPLILIPPSLHTSRISAICSTIVHLYFSTPPSWILREVSVPLDPRVSRILYPTGISYRLEILEGVIEYKPSPGLIQGDVFSVSWNLSAHYIIFILQTQLARLNTTVHSPATLCCTIQNVNACRARQRSFDLCPPSLTSHPIICIGVL